MTDSALNALIEELRNHPAIQSKRAISDAAKGLGLAQHSVGHPGDDAAILPRVGGYDLLAGEGFIPQFVKSDPWFAGWCGVMVNLSDIAAMGGRGVALIDQIWAPNSDLAGPLLAGLKAASDAYGVPVVGGHTNFSATELGLAVTVLGRAQTLITSFDAAPGDVIVAAIDRRGAFRNYDNFFAAGDAPADRLRNDLELLPRLAESELVSAGKDVSQSGIAGTSLMLAECSDVGIELDLDAIDPPAGIPLSRWLRAFPSYGFLLAAPASFADRVVSRFTDRDISAAVIGRVFQGNEVRFSTGGETAPFWNYANEPYLGFRQRDCEHA